jgi:hypothetical protein
MGAVQRRDCCSLLERNTAGNDEHYGKKARFQSNVRVCYLNQAGLIANSFFSRKSQYTAKIKAWRLEKYANCTMWKYVDQEMKKRKLKGKDSVFEIRGRKRSRKSIEREISRNVTYTSQVQLLEDIPTPEGIQVFTPCEELLPIVLREVYTGNLPCFEIQRDIRMMMSKCPAF